MKVPELNVFSAGMTSPKTRRYLSPVYQSRFRNIQNILKPDPQLLNVKSTKTLANFHMRNTDYEDKMIVKPQIRQIYGDVNYLKKNEFLNRTLQKLNNYELNTMMLYKCNKCKNKNCNNNGNQECIQNIKVYQKLQRQLKERNLQQQLEKQRLIQQKYIQQRLQNIAQKDYQKKIKMSSQTLNTQRSNKKQKKRSLQDFEDKQMLQVFKKMLTYYGIKDLSQKQIEQMLLLLQEVGKMNIKFGEKKKLLLSKINRWRKKGINEQSLQLNKNRSVQLNINEDNSNEFKEKIQKLFNKIQGYQFDIFNRLKNEQDASISLSSLIQLKDENIRLNRNYIKQIDNVINKVEKSDQNNKITQQFSFFK